MHHRDLSHRAGDQGLDQFGQREDYDQHGEDDGADHVEEQMDAGGPLGVPAGAEGGHDSSNTGADVLAEQDVNGP